MAATARELAAAEEHRRLSEELHDTLGHALVGTLLQIQLAGKLVKTDSEAAFRRLELVEKNVRETLQQVRYALRRGKRGIETLPLHLALESLAAEFRALGGPEVILTFRPDGESVSDLSPGVREALFPPSKRRSPIRSGMERPGASRSRREASGPRLFSVDPGRWCRRRLVCTRNGAFGHGEPDPIRRGDAPVSQPSRPGFSDSSGSEAQVIRILLAEDQTLSAGRFLCPSRDAHWH